MFEIDRSGLVAGLFHGGDQFGRFDLAEQIEMRALAGEVDAHLAHPRHLAQGALDAADATGTGHAVDGQFQAVAGYLVAGLFHSCDQGGQAIRTGDLHTGLLAGQVDAGLDHTGHLAQGAFDPAGATGAGHAGDRQVEFDGVGAAHGRFPP
ncbi:hypothetical protein D3C81_856960 [compost metagenome]